MLQPDFFSYWALSLGLSSAVIVVRAHDIHSGSKSYKLKLLGKLVAQHGIRNLFGGRSCARTSLPYIYTPKIYYAQKRLIVVVCIRACVSPCTCMGLHLREDVRGSRATLEKRMLEGMRLHLKEDVPYPHVENTLPQVQSHTRTWRDT